MQSGKLCCHSETDYSRHIIGPGTDPSLLVPPPDERRERSAFPDVYGANSLWTVYLVAGQAEHIHTHGIDIQRYLAHSLNSIGMK